MIESIDPSWYPLIEKFNSSFYFTFSVFLTWLFCVAIHEMAHYFLLQHYTKRDIQMFFKRTDKFPFGKTTIEVGTPEDYEPLNDLQYIAVLLIGIVAGFIPVAFTVLMKQYWMAFFSMVLYVSFIGDDTVNIWKTIKSIRLKKNTTMS